MSKFKKIGIPLGREFRNSLNWNFDLVDLELEIIKRKYNEQIANATDVTEIKDSHISAVTGKRYNTMGLRFDDLDRQIIGAMSQSEFESWVATILDGGPSIFMETYSQLVSTYPDGAAGIVLVRETNPPKIYVWSERKWNLFGDYQGVEVKDGTLTTPKYADHSIIQEKTNFAVVGKNKFDGNYHHAAIMYDFGEYVPDVDALTAVVKVDKNKVYTISRGQGGDRFRVATMVESPIEGKIVNRYLNFVDWHESETVIMQGEEDHLLIYVKSPSGTEAPEFLQVEEGNSVTTFRSHGTQLNYAEASIPAHALQGVTNQGSLTGRPQEFNIDLENERIQTQSTGFLSMGSERYDLRTKSYSFKETNYITVMVVFDPLTRDLLFFSSNQITEKKRFGLPIVGMIRKDTKTVFFNGAYSVNGNIVSTFTAKEKTHIDKTVPLAYHAGSADAFNIDRRNFTVTLKHQGGLFNIGKSRYVPDDGTYSYASFGNQTVFITFNVATLKVEIFSSTNLTAQDLTVKVPIGIIRKGESGVDVRGSHSINGKPVIPFTGDTINTTDFLITGMYFGDYLPTSSYVDDGRNVTVENIYRLYDYLVEEFPDYVKRSFLGTEPTQNLPIYRYDFIPPKSIGFSNYTIPKIYYQTGIHGHEKKGVIGTYVFFRDLCEDWMNQDVLKMLRWNVAFSVVPAANPSGINTHSRKNGRGVDLNRNFASGWDDKEQPDSWYYQGPSALSEIETQIISEIMKEPDIIFAFDHHNFEGIREGNPHAFWIGSNREKVKKLMIGLNAQVSSFMKSEFDYIDQGNNSLTNVSGVSGATTTNEWESKGKLGMLFETGDEIGGSPEDVQRFTAYAVGNSILAVIREWEKIK